MIAFGATLAENRAGAFFHKIGVEPSGAGDIARECGHCADDAAQRLAPCRRKTVESAKPCETDRGRPQRHADDRDAAAVDADDDRSCRNAEQRGAALDDLDLSGVVSFEIPPRRYPSKD